MSAKLTVSRLNASSIELQIYGDIGDPFDGITAKQVGEVLSDAGDVDLIRVRLNSLGGSANEGVAIYNRLKQHPARVEVDVDGVAASAASVVALAGNTVRMGKAALIMIHEAAAGLLGFYGADELMAVIEGLESVNNVIVDLYADATGTPADEIRQMMAATTWFDGEEAVAAGFATELVEELPIAASFDWGRVPEPPADKRQRLQQAMVARPPRETTADKGLAVVRGLKCQS
ncbi:MAG: head maturation protease, ClpP-related [Planctomycetota bacterium]